MTSRAPLRLCCEWPGLMMPVKQLGIARLKRVVTELKAERDILKRAAAYFAKEPA